MSHFRAVCLYSLDADWIWLRTVIFLAAAGWPGFFFSFTSTILTFVAWRRSKAARRDMSDASYDSTEKF